MSDRQQTRSGPGGGGPMGGHRGPMAMMPGEFVIAPIRVATPVVRSIVYSDEDEMSVPQPYIVPVVGSIAMPVQLSPPYGVLGPMAVTAPVVISTETSVFVSSSIA